VSDESHLATLNGHERTTCSLNFSHDGKLLVSVGSDDHNTAIVWDWKHHTSLARCSAGGQPVFDMRFNPYQAYGIPDSPPLPGQAPSEDDAVYTLTSCGVRHIKFWVFLRSQDEDSDIPEAKRWYLEGNNVNYATKTSVQDITCFTFVDDSRPLTIRNERGRLESIEGSTERTDSRVVAGTSDGDVFVFKQPEVKLRYGNSSKEPEPWWIMDTDNRSGSEGRVSKRMLWDSFAALIGIIPHNISAGNRYILPRKDRDEIDRLTAKLRLQSHNSELKKKVRSCVSRGYRSRTSMRPYV
jgi:microtubule-associated protein-like 6